MSNDIKTQWNEFGQLNSYEQLNQYMADRKYRSTNYCHYTKSEIINSIVKNREIWFGSVKNLNDTIDMNQFPKNKKNAYYVLCFSSGVNENLSLWYMYAGMDGKGARLRITSRFVDEFINGEYSLYEKNENGLGNIVVQLSSSDIDIKCQDVLYYRERDDKDYVDLKYSTLTNYNKITKNMLEKYKEEHIGFNKKIIWYYEKEHRVLIEIRNPEVLKLMENDKNYVIVHKLNDNVIKNLHIELAPEIDSFEEIENDSRYKDIIAYRNSKNSAVNLSEYHGEIKIGKKE